MVSPPKIGTTQEIVSAIFKWEAKITNVLKRYGESIGPKLKTAIMVAMMPKGIKEDLTKHSCMQTSLKYDGISSGTVARPPGERWAGDFQCVAEISKFPSFPDGKPDSVVVANSGKTLKIRKKNIQNPDKKR